MRHNWKWTNAALAVLATTVITAFAPEATARDGFNAHKLLVGA